MHTWTAADSHAIHKEPFHPQKVWVWCALSCTHITGPILSHTTVNLNIFQESGNQLNDWELTLSYLKQDEAMFHTLSRASEENKEFLLG
jgi:hypothetical protein